MAIEKNTFINFKKIQRENVPNEPAPKEVKPNPDESIFGKGKLKGGGLGDVATTMALGEEGGGDTPVFKFEKL